MTAAPPIPTGFRVALDAQTTVLQGGRILVGGQPRRVLRLSAAGAAAFAELQAGPARTTAARALARRLCAVGAAHPRPPQGTFAGRVVVIVPVRDRAPELERCLEAAGSAHEVVVVDDGSRDPDAVAKVVARHGATLVERAVSGGPAAARNTGLEWVRDADVVAFLDSDVVPPRGWLDPLLAQFADPVVGAVAPRVVPLTPSRSGTLARYAAAKSPLDLGAAEALVRPGTPVSYVPTAALVVRTQALIGLSFDETLPYGEDVNLIWRLVDAGWHVRYDPSVRVQHDEPDSWGALLRRRFRYGTSAGPLARRHPSRLTPLVIRPWPAATLALVAARRPLAATAVFAAGAGQLARRLRNSGAPPSLAVPMTGNAVLATAADVGRTVTQLILPAALAAAAMSRRRRRHFVTLGALAATPVLRDWLSRRPALDPLRWTVASVADEVAYGAGVWTGAIQACTARPLLPRVVHSQGKPMQQDQ